MRVTTKEHYERVIAHVWEGERQDDDPRWVKTAVDDKNNVVAGYLQNGKSDEIIAKYDLRKSPPYYAVHINYFSI